MVDLSGSNSVLQHSFDNSVFIIPALIIVAIVAIVTYNLTSSLKLKQRREEERRRKREARPKKRN